MFNGSVIISPFECNFTNRILKFGPSFPNEIIEKDFLVMIKNDESLELAP